MVKSIIVEDDPGHSSRLKDFLVRLGVPIEVLAIAVSVKEAVSAIEEHSPDLVFLDIELEGSETGFNLLDLVDKKDFDIIFTTAHIDKNIQEIRLCGVEYIVKPYVMSEVKEKLEKYLLEPSFPAKKERLHSLQSNMLLGNNDQKTVWVADKTVYFQVYISQILFCESDNQYTHVHILEDEGATVSRISSKGLGEWEKDLRGYNFCRIHRKYLANKTHISQFQKSEDRVLLTSGKYLDVSANGKEELLKMMKL